MRESQELASRVPENGYEIHRMIVDTGASGGIIVSPLPLQEGAKKVAEANNTI
jgi:hypothetical protein